MCLSHFNCYSRGKSLTKALRGEEVACFDIVQKFTLFRGSKRGQTGGQKGQIVPISQ